MKFGEIKSVLNEIERKDLLYFTSFGDTRVPYDLLTDDLEVEVIYSWNCRHMAVEDADRISNAIENHDFYRFKVMREDLKERGDTDSIGSGEAAVYFPALEEEGVAEGWFCTLIVGYHNEVFEFITDHDCFGC